MTDKQAFVTGFEAFEASQGHASPPWVRDIRRTAIDRFEEQGFPTTKNEAWRFTRVRPLLQHDYTLAAQYRKNGLASKQLEELSFPDRDCHRLVFVNGHYAGNLSSSGSLPDGVRITSLKAALERHPDLVRAHLARHADSGKHPFVALNTAYLYDGAFVYVPRETVLEKPVHLLFVAAAGDGITVSHPRNLIVLEESSEAAVLESYVSTSNDVHFTNAVTEAVVRDNARLDHCKVQKENHSAYHMASLQVHLGGDSRFDSDSISLGGALVRNDVTTVLDGEGIECSLDGLYAARDHQHVDNHTTIEHAKPHCESHELYKGILTGRAKAVFNGRIHVHPDAQKTDAKQSNGCMLLSDDAQINTNPQLEIYADDVKCTHGAVVGQIDENAIFYLRTRGIGETEARRMMIFAFANEVLERVKVDALRERLSSDLVNWLSVAQQS